MKRRNFLEMLPYFGMISTGISGTSFSETPNSNLDLKSTLEAFYLFSDQEGNISLFYETAKETKQTLILENNVTVFNEKKSEFFTYSQNHIVYFHSNFVFCKNPTIFVFQKQQEVSKLFILEFIDLKPVLKISFDLNFSEKSCQFVSSMKNIFPNHLFTVMFANTDNFFLVAVTDTLEIKILFHSLQENIFQNMSPQFTWISSCLSNTDRNIFLSEQHGVGQCYFELNQTGFSVLSTLEINTRLSKYWTLQLNTQNYYQDPQKDIFFGTLSYTFFEKNIQESFVYYVKSKYIALLSFDDTNQLSVSDFISIDDAIPRLIVSPKIKSQFPFPDILVLTNKKCVTFIYKNRDNETSTVKITSNDLLECEIDVLEFSNLLKNQEAEFFTLKHVHNKKFVSCNYAIYSFQIRTSENIYQFDLKLDCENKIQGKLNKISFENLDFQESQNKTLLPSINTAVHPLNFQEDFNHFDFRSYLDHFCYSSLSFGMGDVSLFKGKMRTNYFYVPKPKKENSVLKSTIRDAMTSHALMGTPTRVPSPVDWELLEASSSFCLGEFFNKGGNNRAASSPILILNGADVRAGFLSVFKFIETYNPDVPQKTDPIVHDPLVKKTVIQCINRCLVNGSLPDIANELDLRENIQITEIPVEKIEQDSTQPFFQRHGFEVTGVNLIKKYVGLNGTTKMQSYDGILHIYYSGPNFTQESIEEIILLNQKNIDPLGRAEEVTSMNLLFGEGWLV